MRWIKQFFNKKRGVPLIWGEEVPRYMPDAPYPIGGSRCPICEEVEIYDGFTPIKKHVCKERPIK